MGSAHYGQLVLDGEEIDESSAIEASSLVWSADGRWLAAQQLVSWSDAPTTRVVVIDTARRTKIAESRPRTGLAIPLRFESETLVYRYWHPRAGDQEMHVTVPSARSVG